MKFVRWLLGRVILILDFLTRPKPIVRDRGEQDKIDARTSSMAIYQFEACPFCVKVRRELRRHALHIELRDAKNDSKHKEELIAEGGKHKVPCLRIDDGSGDAKWLYESDEIIKFLKAEFNLA